MWYVGRALSVTRGSRPEDQASGRLCETRWQQRHPGAAGLEQTVRGEALQAVQFPKTSQEQCSHGAQWVSTGLGANSKSLHLSESQLPEVSNESYTREHLFICNDLSTLCFCCS